ncbi:MAG: aminotransferase class V-fold PLP-dependent enzyme, partial [Pirellulaceae bacterium]
MIDLSDLPPIPQTWLDWPPADADVEEALQETYRNGTWGHYHGPRGQELEACLAEFYQVDHALTCSSGTVAVTIALRGLHLPAESEVLLAAYDFPGNFRAIQEAGLRPVLVDIDPETWCLDLAQIEAACSSRTAAMIVSHLHGGLAPMPQIMDLAARQGLLVVEDACQAPGALIGKRRVASWGDVGVVSFGGSKLLTAGRGGAVLTSRGDVMQRAKIYCERGNHAFPLSELQATVLLPQLKKLAPRDLT